MGDATADVGPPPKPGGRSPRRDARRLAGLADILGLVLVLGALILVFGLASRNFWTWRTLQSVVNQVPDLVVVAAGMTLVVIAGGIDLSVGSVLALSGAVLGIAMAGWGWPLWPSVALCLAVGAACGFLNGSVCVAWSIPSFIVTLGMLEVARAPPTGSPTRRRSTSAPGSSGWRGRSPAWGPRRPSSPPSRSSSSVRSC